MKSSDSFANSHVAGHVIGGGRYSLHVPLGDSGHVWLAQDEVEQRLVVIRFLPADLRDDPRALDTIRARVEKAAQVRHRNVARILEWYQADGVEPFIACEYVEGTPAGQASNVKPGSAMSWSKAESIAADIAAGLAALHEAGVVHHGVEPLNVFVAADGAKLLNCVTTGTLRNPLFVPAALGSPELLRCFSPQQINGNEPTPADDYFSLGATLFELLTGSPLFADAATSASPERTAPPGAVLARLNAQPGIPTAIAEFITACVSADMAARPTSLAVLLRAQKVSPAVDNEPHVVPLVVDPQVLPPSEAALVKQTLATARRRHSAMPWLAAACVVVCASIGGAAWYVQQSRAERNTRIIAAEQQAARQAEEADIARRAAAQKDKELAAERARAESEAREKMEAERRVKELEAARIAAAEQERRSVHAQFVSTRVPAAAPVEDLGAKAKSPLPFSQGEEGFVSLFNGRDLSDWVGNSNTWSVMDGCITGQSGAKLPPQKRQYLVSKKESVQDFELQFSYRFRVLRGNKNPNAGLVYRARTNNTPELSAYQFDITPDVKNIGAVNEDKRRYRMAGYGEGGIARTNDKTEVVMQLTETNTLRSIRAEDWNTCVIVARGNQLTHYVNGVVTANVVDEHAKKLHKSGMIALELHTKNTNNASTFVQFRDIKLKRLSSSNLASTR